MPKPPLRQALAPRALKEKADQLRYFKLWRPLPLQVSVVATAAQLQEALALRVRRYREHDKRFAPQGEVPEAEDLMPESLVLLVRHAKTGQVLGTARYREWALREDGNTAFDEDTWPARLHALGNVCIVERLTVARGVLGPYAKLLLFKAVYYLAFSRNVDYMTLYTKPALQPMYKRLCFTPPPSGPYVLDRVPGFVGVPHQLLVSKVEDFRANLGPEHVMYRLSYKEQPEVLDHWTFNRAAARMLGCREKARLLQSEHADLVPPAARPVPAA